MIVSVSSVLPLIHDARCVPSSCCRRNACRPARRGHLRPNRACRNFSCRSGSRCTDRRRCRASSSAAEPGSREGARIAGHAAEDGGHRHRSVDGHARAAGASFSARRPRVTGPSSKPPAYSRSKQRARATTIDDKEHALTDTTLLDKDAPDTVRLRPRRGDSHRRERAAAPGLQRRGRAHHRRSARGQRAVRLQVRGPAAHTGHRRRREDRNRGAHRYARARDAGVGADRRRQQHRLHRRLPRGRSRDRKARKSGMAPVGANNSYFSGRNALLRRENRARRVRRLSCVERMAARAAARAAPSPCSARIPICFGFPSEKAR